MDLVRYDGHVVCNCCCVVQILLSSVVSLHVGPKLQSFYNASEG